MENSTDRSLTETPFSASEIILSRTNNAFIQELIEQAIPADVWTAFETTAAEAEFLGFDCSIEKQNIHKNIMQAIDDIWHNAWDIEKPGDTMTDLTLEVKFLSLVSQTQITFKVMASATERKVEVAQATNTGVDATITDTITTFQPEDIPFVIEGVRTGTTGNLSRLAVATIKEELEKNPNWTGDDITEMYTIDSDLELYRLTIKPALFFESTRAEISASSESAVATPISAIEETTPPFKKIRSSEKEIKGGLFRNGIHMQYKAKPYHQPDIQSELESLSMN